MTAATTQTYLAEIVAELNKPWPGNRTINLVFHGHSVPAGYFATPMVDTFNAYPHLTHVALKQRFPLAVINAVVTAVGGENSRSGAERFARDVLCHRPDVILLDYALNDRGLGLAAAEVAWRRMIEDALAARLKMILLTPTSDRTQEAGYAGADREALPRHAGLVRQLAAEYGVGLADSLAAFEANAQTGNLLDLLSWVNHPNRRGHDLVVREILRWFPPGP